MRITQGTFSYLPDLTDDEIGAQLRYALDEPAGRSRSSTPTTRIPATPYWDMWGLPMFDLDDQRPVVVEFERCREAFPEHYVKVVGLRPGPHRQTTAFDLVVHRPPVEPGFTLERQEVDDRRIRYTLRVVRSRPSARGPLWA